MSSVIHKFIEGHEFFIIFKCRTYLIGYDRSVPKLRQASHCIGCGYCKPDCPQLNDIPGELHHIDRYAESLKQDRFVYIAVLSKSFIGQQYI